MVQPICANLFLSSDGNWFISLPQYDQVLLNHA
jgi:hypothetical protein